MACWLVAAAFAVLNVVAVAVMASDKSRAQRGRGRVAESVFYRFALVGAVVGIVAASLLLRHKTRKPVFLGVVVAMGLAGLGLWAVIAYAVGCLG